MKKEIDDEIHEVFQKLVKTKKNVSYVYNFVYSDTSSFENEDIKGSIHMKGKIRVMNELILELKDRFLKRYKNKI